MQLRLILLTLIINFCSQVYAQDGPVAGISLYEFTIEETGVYELSYDLLKQTLKTSGNIIDIRNLHIYGKTAGKLPESVSWEEQQGTQEIAYYVTGDDDNTLTEGERIICYAEGADKIAWSESEDRLLITKNPYSDIAKLYLQLNEHPRKQITTSSDVSALTKELTSTLALSYIVSDQVNLLSLNSSGQGSGQQWFGQELNSNQSLQLDQIQSIPNSASNMTLRASIAVRSDLPEEIVFFNGQTETSTISGVSDLGDVEAIFARQVHLNSSVFDIDKAFLSFTKKSANARAWIDQLELQYEHPLRITDQPLIFNNQLNRQLQADGLKISASDEIIIWDVTSPTDPVSLSYNYTENEVHLLSSTTAFKQYVGFSEEMSFPAPHYVKEVQFNSTRCDNCQMIILYPDLFEQSAIDLATYREKKDELKVKTVDISDLYVQYSAGQPDPTAIRNYIRDIYFESSSFEYLLLLGDASYDYRGINKSIKAENFIPTYQTIESLDPLLAFPTDDYYALLDADESGALRGDLDIAVGRIIARTPSEANAIINKIKTYEANLSPEKDWLSRIAFFADDEDNNLHINDSERIAAEMAETYPFYEQEKIYWDAFVQTSTPGGNRYPDAVTQLNKVVADGALIMNYIGHGGPRGWSQERVLNIDDLNKWNNLVHLPLIVTATCSFTGFDDPSTESAGEQVFTNPAGGAIALFTTVRSVFASQNFRLTRAVFRNVFTQENGHFLSLGEIMKRAKNDNANDNINTRKFFLIGDPSMRLLQPSYQVNALTINKKPLLPAAIVDTVGALDQVQITAEIVDGNDERVENYHGVADIVVYDKAKKLKTLANDSRSFVREFDVNGAILFKGKAAIRNGSFSINFVVPLDIDYDYGLSRIRFSASDLDNSLTAIGATNKLVIGGNNPAPIPDTKGPLIKLSIANAFGRSVDALPSSVRILAVLSDESGINIANTAIGHEITAILDGDEKSAMILNNSFSPSIHYPGSGEVIVPLDDLDLGEHELLVRAYDVYNNVNYSTIRFTVIPDASVKMDAVVRPNFLYHHQELIFDISHELGDVPTSVTLTIFNNLGQEVFREQGLQPSVDGKISFRRLSASLVSAPGIYYAHFKIQNSLNPALRSEIAKKIMILK